jgi:transcriptional regulator with XRE-family HTH domain
MHNKLTNDILKKQLSAKLALLRSKTGETIENVAVDLEMNTSDYFKLLKGQRLPHLLNLCKLSQKYSVPLDWWFNDLKGIPKTTSLAKRDCLEAQVTNALKKLDPKAQRAALAALKTLAKNLK